MSDEAHTIPDHVASRVARLINEAEDMRQQAADDLKQIYADLREELRGMGWTGSVVSVEVAALKGAIADMRMDEQKVAALAYRGDDTHGEPTVREIEKVQPETATLRAGPQYSAVPGGEPSIPSSDDGGAKTEGRANDLLGRSDDKSVTHNSQSEQAANSIPDDDVPAFIKRDRKPLRPNCLNPDNCAGYGSHTCHSCIVAAREVEPA